MFQKNSISALMILFAFALSGCSTVEIKDHEVCSDKGELGARCGYMLSDRTRVLDFYQWQDERIGQLCLRSDGFGNLKAALLKLCDSTQRCKWEELQKIRTILERIEDVQYGF